MFLSTLQSLLQNLHPGANCKITGSSLYLEHVDFIGFVKISDHGDYAFIDQIFVASSKQGKGIGSQVLATIELACKTNNLTHIECYATQGDMLSGISFFEGKGFTQIASTRYWRKKI